MLARSFYRQSTQERSSKPSKGFIFVFFLKIIATLLFIYVLFTFLVDSSDSTFTKKCKKITFFLRIQKKCSTFAPKTYAGGNVSRAKGGFSDILNSVY